MHGIELYPAEPVKFDGYPALLQLFEDPPCSATIWVRRSDNQHEKS